MLYLKKQELESLLEKAGKLYQELWQWEILYSQWKEKKSPIPKEVLESLKHDDWERKCESFPLLINQDNVNYSQAKQEFLTEEGLPITIRYRTGFSDTLYLDGMVLRAKENLPQDYLKAAFVLSRFPWLKADFPEYTGEKNPALLGHLIKRYYFRRIILGRKPSCGLRFLDKTGWLSLYLPEVTAGKDLTQNRFHAYDIFEHLLRSLDGVVEADEEVRWAALLHDIGKVDTRRLLPNGEASFHNHEVVSARKTVDIMKRLGIPKELGQRVRFLVRNHMFHYTDEWTDRAVRRFMRRVSREDLKKLIALRLADRKGSGKKTAFPKALEKLMAHIEQVEKEEKRFKVKDLAINGYDLMNLGMKPGPEMGELLRRFTEAVANGLLENDPEILLARAKEEISRKAS